ncbi:MAG: hypothetical protein WDO24_12565 [Pseudomonadota bacterium]
MATHRGRALALALPVLLAAAASSPLAAEGPADRGARAAAGATASPPAAAAGGENGQADRPSSIPGWRSDATRPGQPVELRPALHRPGGQPLLNQLMVGIERPVEPTAETDDIGFKLQAMYGSDARYTHSLACSTT